MTVQTKQIRLSDIRVTEASSERELYECMLTIRRFEEKVKELAMAAQLEGAVHVCIGQEAVAVGACGALRAEDLIIATHRGHGHCIAKGQRTDLMMAELMGRATGYCKGKGGSMHLAAFELGVLGANGIVGGGTPISVGVGLSLRLQKSPQILLCFFGDGALNQGALHEALNLASLWKLPVVFLCENNQYAVSTPVHAATCVPRPALRAIGYGIPGSTVDGNDVLTIRAAVAQAVARARNSEGPSFIVAETYRIEGHYIGDPMAYRSKEETARWRERDPIAMFGKALVAKGAANQAWLQDCERRVQSRIAEAVEFAQKSPAPALEEAASDVYAPSVLLPAEGGTACSQAVLTGGALVASNQCHPSPQAPREITMREALNEALAEEMARDERVILFGEDVGRHGGAFQVSKGLWERFGPDRVRDTPISEAAIVGTAVGAALNGLRPVCEIQYSDFSTLAMDQIANQAAKIRYMFGGKATLPLVVRMPGGSGGRGNAAQHSQSLEAWFMHVPGLKVILPGTPYDAKGLLKAAIRDNNPVIFIEHKAIYNLKGPVPEGEYSVPLGKAEVKREGKDVTILTYSRMLSVSLAVAETLAKHGIQAEVVDLRSLLPLDEKTLFDSVRKTGRVVIVEEDCRTAGAGAEILSRVVEGCFDYLDAPVIRVAGLDAPIAYNRTLERASVPSEQDVVKAVKGIVGR
jgi:pyruvate/2-oxoglutarate/acetoin dehydrogenase E1 component/TPP-dependent pyruvate/acetoin dehydrogenase alpha subunit